MHTTQFIEALETSGSLLLSAALRAGWETAVPSCPGWRVRDLVRHQGNVHRWADEYVRQGITQPCPLPDHRVGDDELAAWFEKGLRSLANALRTADDTLVAWEFLPGAAHPRAFWARRQAHETTMHRVDAELVGHGLPSPVAADLALDGIDEMLTGWHGRPRSLLRADKPTVLLVEAVEGRQWTMRLSSAAPRTVRASTGTWDCRISGPADRLYRALWNREPYTGNGIVVEGDERLMALWRSKSPIL
ncbi:maleylpyruvate isomerase family mycothiol-dependent enzyme [Streptomyces sp. NPDC093261]|uniref:maleylpyruvate isomerase family mycothiol-dependent enzyme n=1 Tax=Streptomyces sp. NPDC093261 TaxID=3366037 RepID=UPI0038247D7C